MKEFLINKKNFIYLVFQFFIFILLFDYFFTYIVIFNICVFYSILAYFDNNKVQFGFIFLVLVLVLVLVYSIFSIFYKNPNYYYDKNGLKEGTYLIEEYKIETRQMGSLTGRDSLVEPSSRDSLSLKNVKTGGNVLIECSIAEQGCPFSNKINNLIYVKYVESGFFSRKYAFYLDNSGKIYDENYFKEKYKKENYMKSIFIIFYFGGCFFYMYVSIR